MTSNTRGGFLCLLIIASLGGFSQKPLICGNGKIDTAAEAAAAKYRNSGYSQLAPPNYLVRIYFHIVRNSDGTNAALSIAQMAAEYASLQATYAPNNICFLNCGFDYITSTTLNTGFNADDDSDGDAFSSYQIPGCINIFYLRKINGNNTACSPPCGYGGIALGGIPGTFFLVATGNIGPGSTIGHEMGHNLGLMHTFDKRYGYENIDGSNSSTAADRVSDTNADPFTYNDQSCYGSNNCVYTGSCKDPNGASNFSPPYSNLMSYWGSCGTYPYVTTNGQFSRVNSFLNTNAELMNCTSPASVDISNAAPSSGLWIRSAINNLSAAGIVLLTGTVKATLAAANVTLGPGFIASPANGGLVEIKTIPCN